MDYIAMGREQCAESRFRENQKDKEQNPVLMSELFIVAAGGKL